MPWITLAGELRKLIRKQEVDLLMRARQTEKINKIGWSPWMIGKGYIIFAAPTVAAIIVAGLTDRKNGLKAVGDRLVNWRASPVSYARAPAFDQRLWIITAGVVAASGLATVFLTKGKFGYREEI